MLIGCASPLRPRTRSSAPPRRRRAHIGLAALTVIGGLGGCLLEEGGDGDEAWDVDSSRSALAIDNGFEINGISGNGAYLNGLSFNSAVPNGLIANGVPLNGVPLNGLLVNGL